MKEQTMPPMEKSDEASSEQLQLARDQGQTMEKALKEMMHNVADDAAEKRAGDYYVGYAIEKAEGMYELRDGELIWQEPGDANLHLEISVRDAADGRFVPHLNVQATLIDSRGNDVGKHQQPFIWHPWLYHYGRNWTVPEGGAYRLHVRIEPPTFHRHDKKNGLRYAETVEVTFDNVQIKTGKK